ncbi:SDR family NAD(P)-dependent oxidoreductase [Nakamurella leprariae]|uniref:SDR family NAD(P)-dependent oxidoreductase n=1 Tax=Nakamurella leprariae TaxID=2803911 RepID=UPI001F352318|nr:SDR family oxidoreductase [Nakamurella leprariae]
MAGAGARVAIADLDADRAAATAAELGDAALAAVTDVTDEDSTAAMSAAVLDRWGRIDGLVNNAGGAMYPTAPIDTVPRTQWDHVLAVNLTGQWLCTVAVLPAMRAAGSGKIVNICSSSYFTGGPIGLAPYIAAKGGALGLTRALARELGGDNICVNAVSPGYVPVDTPKAVHDPAAAQALIERTRAEQCLHRTETPEDLAGTIEFLCSGDSDFVTGQVFNVDGGWTHN